MIGMIVSIVLFNTLAFKFNKRSNRRQVAHIWMFTLAFQGIFDTYLDIKFHGYWYYTKSVDWESLPAITVLVPPINILFINWYPFGKKLRQQVIYVICWVILIVGYEAFALLPEPIGFYNYGWWRMSYTVLLDPVLFIILILYYRFFIAEK